MTVYTPPVDKEGLGRQTDKKVYKGSFVRLIFIPFKVRYSKNNKKYKPLGDKMALVVLHIWRYKSQQSQLQQSSTTAFE